MESISFINEVTLENAKMGKELEGNLKEVRTSYIKYEVRTVRMSSSLSKLKCMY